MAINGYFRRLTEQTQTRLWVNNVTRAEAILGLDAGAVGCTQNPSYTWKILSSDDDKQFAEQLLDEIVGVCDDDNAVEAMLQARLVKGIAEKFLPLYQESHGKYGYVSIQSDPTQENCDFILAEAFENRKLSPNIMIKVPAVEEGLKAMERLVAAMAPINATEVMAVSQALDVCEMYERATRGITNPAPLYISHIAGIYDEYLAKYVRENKVNISHDVLWQAGLAVARKAYRMIRERGYNVGFIAGGARALHHFTEMVGGDVAVTINWTGTADKLIELDPPVVSRLFNPVSDFVIDELIAKLPDFRKGYLKDGLEPKEYETFGPVVHFRNLFVDSWQKALKAIASARSKVRQ